MASLAMSDGSAENPPDPAMKASTILPIADTSSSCNGSAQTSQEQDKKSTTDQGRYTSSSRREYITMPGEDDSRRPLLPKSSSRSRALGYEKNREPVILKDMKELQQHLELMHDRCIARNLRAAGLGGFDIEEEAIYGNLDPNAHLITGEVMLTATILYLKEPDRLHHYVAILLNDGADVNVQDGQGKTALMHAILNRKDKAAKALLRHEKSDLLIRDNEGHTALMHAAAMGSELILYSFFKALRKREKRQAHQQRQHALEEFEKSSKDSSKNQILESGRNGTQDARELWSLLRSDDPLEIQNHQGQTAHALALKNGHVECANMISDEKVKRAKEMTKRLNAINHQRGTGSPSILNLAKRSAKRYLQHYGSFDSVYFDREDDSDDELMMAGSHMRRSRTAAAGLGVKEGTQKTPYPTTSSNQQAQQQHQTKLHHSQQHAKKGLLVRLNKRFQSNPDLFRVKASASCLPVPEDVANAPGTSDGQETFSINQQADVCSTDVKDDIQRRQAAAKSISAGHVQGHNAAPQPNHQPVIKRGSVHIMQRRPSCCATGQAPHKRNLAEKLMSFLRIRPKYMAPNEASDSPDPSSSKFGRDPKRTFSKKHSKQFQNFDTICHEGDMYTESGDKGKQMKKGHSQPNITPRSESVYNTKGRRGSTLAYRVAERTISVPDPQALSDQRHSVDFTPTTSSPTQHLARPQAQPKTYPSECSYMDGVDGDVIDAAMVKFTPFAASPV